MGTRSFFIQSASTCALPAATVHTTRRRQHGTYTRVFIKLQIVAEAAMTEKATENVTALRPLSDDEALAFLRDQPDGKTTMSQAALAARWGWSRHAIARRLKAWGKRGLVKRKGDALLAAPARAEAPAPQPTPARARTHASTRAVPQPEKGAPAHTAAPPEHEPRRPPSINPRHYPRRRPRHRPRMKPRRHPRSLTSCHPVRLSKRSCATRPPCPRGKQSQGRHYRRRRQCVRIRRAPRWCPCRKAGYLTRSRPWDGAGA
jgi:MarR family